MLPTIPVRDPNNPGGYGYGDAASPTFGTNPVGLLEQQPRTERSNQVIGSAFGEVRLPFNLKYRLNLGLNYENFGRTEFTSITQLRNSGQREDAELNEIRNDFTSLLSENLLSYDGDFGGTGRHRVNAVAGYTEQLDNADDVTAYCKGFADENLRTISACDQVNATSLSRRRKTVLHSYLVRANYTAFDRYLITGSVRRDGSSRFGPENRWGTFSALSAGWIISDEGFWQSVPGLRGAEYLKLRASTGTLGNQDIGDYQYTVGIDQGRLGYTFGGTVVGGATQLRLANPRIRWQENKQDNIGFDLGLMNSRLNVTADYYRSTSSGLLVSAPLPWSLGTGEDIGRTPVVNAGSMRNTGAELGVSLAVGERDRAAGGFRLNTTLTLMTTKNRVLSLGNGGQPLFDNLGIARTAVGGSVGEFYLVRMAGIFQTAEEVAGYKNKDGKVIQPNAKPGDVKYVDANGDGQIDNNDRVNVGNGTPKVSGGLFFDGGYGRFDFGLNLRGAGGFKIFNGVKYWTDRMDDPSNFRAGFQPWTPENRSTTTPRALAAGSDNTRFNSDRWVEDGDYLRLQNVVVGYTLPTSLTDRVFGGRASSSRVYLNVQNLKTFTGFSNWDPETLGYGNPLGRGIDDGTIYPNVRTVSFGLDLRL
jgi:TonB-dependent starch-binding outer membrane protein SusC